MRRVAAALLLTLAAAAAAEAEDRAATCADLFWRYDTAVRNYPTSRADSDFGLVPPGPLSRWIVQLRSNDCLTMSRDLDGMPALADRLWPHAVQDSGAAIRPVPVHLGIVTSIGDEAFVTRTFRGLGYNSRGIGAEGLGRRIYIGPFTSEGALAEALAIAREAGFIAPYPAWFTRF